MKTNILTLIILVFGLGAKGQNLEGNFTKSERRWQIMVQGKYNLSSDALTKAQNLRSNISGKYGLGVLVGYNILVRNKAALALETGCYYRDFGFAQNNSTIPYFSIPVGLRLRTPLFWGLSAFSYISCDFNRIIESRYHYLNRENPMDTKYLIYLHQNDAVTYTYGGGFGLTLYSIGLDFFTEKIKQLDTYDKHYGKTIGSQSYGLMLRFGF